MKRRFRKSISLILVVITLLSTLSVFAVSASAASYPTNYSSYDTPESNDYARYNGSKMVKGSSTNKNEVKWIQAALNFCIANRGLNASYLTVDGDFGKNSKNATVAFQKAYGLSADGSFGGATITKMKAVLADRNISNVTSFSSSGLTFDPKGGTMETTKIYSSNGQVTMPYAKKAGKTLLGWTNDRAAKTAVYKPGVTYDLNWTNSTPFFYAVWGDFTQKNILQVNANASSKYLSGSWRNLKNGTGKYSDIQNAGCGIVSLVSAVYNLGGTINDSEVGIAIDEVFDWAYQKGYWRYAVQNRKLFSNSDEKFGNKYGFTISGEYRGTATDARLINHLKNGGTAVVHVYNHFMAVVDYKVENGVEKLLVFDPAPGDGTKYQSPTRDGWTDPEGTWISVKDLKNDGGAKGYSRTKAQKSENIEIDAYWLVSRK